MNDENIIISGSPIEIAEFDTYKLATFLISVLDEFDLNGRMITKEAGEAYHATIRGFPIVAKLIYDFAGNPIDFKGHEMTIIRNKEGNLQAKFGTTPIGSVINSWIEDREVAGYDGLKSCIMIQAKLWSDRYPEYFKVLDKLWAANKVKSSWEIKSSEVEQLPLGKKILKVFSFVGNALLGSNVEGAVPGAGVYEYAELGISDYDYALAEALSIDLCLEAKAQDKEVGEILKKKSEEITETKEVTMEAENAESQENTQEIETTEDIKAPEVESASLTDGDIRDRLNKACRNAVDSWVWVSFVFPSEGYCLCEYEGRPTSLDYLKFTYTVDGENVAVSAPENVKLAVSIEKINDAIAERESALVTANETIQSLQAEIDALRPFKEAAEKAECERIEAETKEKRKSLSEYAQKSKFISLSEIEDKSSDVYRFIAELNQDGIKNIIATRFMDSLNKKEEVVSTEVASIDEPTAEVSFADLNDDDVANASIVSIYLKK